MPEMYGKEQPTIFQEKISFGLNMPTWRKFWGSTQKLGLFLPNGWNGFPGRKHGWALLNLRKEWESLKEQKKYFISI